MSRWHFLRCQLAVRNWHSYFVVNIFGVTVTLFLVAPSHHIWCYNTRGPTNTKSLLVFQLFLWFTDESLLKLIKICLSKLVNSFPLWSFYSSAFSLHVIFTWIPDDVQWVPLLLINKFIVNYSDSGTSRYADELNWMNIKICYKEAHKYEGVQSTSIIASVCLNVYFK